MNPRTQGMSRQQEIEFYRRRAAEARARGKEALAQTMDNYAANLESGIYDDDGTGAFDIGASNRRWAEQEAKQRQEAERRRQAEERLYSQRPAQSSGYGSRSRNDIGGYRIGGNVEGAGYRRAPMDYLEPDPMDTNVAFDGLRYNDSPSYDPGYNDFNQGSWEEARRPSPRTGYPEVGRPGWRDNR